MDGYTVGTFVGTPGTIAPILVQLETSLHISIIC